MSPEWKMALSTGNNVAWNQFRLEKPGPVTFRQVNFSKMKCPPLRGFDFTGCRFLQCTFDETEFHRCLFSWARFRTRIHHAAFLDCDFTKTSFTNCDIEVVVWNRSTLYLANIRKCQIRNNTFTATSLISCQMTGSSLTDSKVYAVNIWDLNLKNTLQANLIVQPDPAPGGGRQYQPVSVNDIELAQFIGLILNNEKLSDVLSVMTSKIILLLGRFTPARKKVLNSLRDELKNRGYSPIIFDFNVPRKKDMIGTVQTLSQMAGLIIADLTEGTSVPFELGTIVQQLGTTPVLPILQKGFQPFAMARSLRRYACVMDLYEYRPSTLLRDLPMLLRRLERKRKELNR
jgi:hypothetical protein